MKFASVDANGWMLESGVERNQEAPDSFFIPEQTKRENLKPGEIAKLIFYIEFENIETGERDQEVERMWVIVTNIFDDSYVGRLDNDPSYIKLCNHAPLQLGAEIPFKSDHVIAIHDSPISKKELKDILSTTSPQPWRRFDA